MLEEYTRHIFCRNKKPVYESYDVQSIWKKQGILHKIVCKTFALFHILTTGNNLEFLHIEIISLWIKTIANFSQL